MIKNTTNKRAQLTQTTLITIIILILSAAIILFFFKTLYLDKQIDREACRASVEIRDNLILRGEGFLPEMAPLKCKTEEIKISTDNPELIKKYLSNAMYDCWWMMGEGKKTPFAESSLKEFGLSKVRSSCVICSTIQFSDNLKKKNLQLDLAQYMSTTKIPLKNITYLDYFSDEINAKLPTGADIPKVSTNQDYVVLFMGIKGDELWEPIAHDAELIVGGLIGNTMVFGPSATGSLLKVGGNLMSKSVTIGGRALSTSGSSVYGSIGGVTTKLGWIGAVIAVAFMATQTAVTANNQQIAAQHCDGEKKGCYQVMMIPLNYTNLNNVCSNIESIP